MAEPYLVRVTAADYEDDDDYGPRWRVSARRFSPLAMPRFGVPKASDIPADVRDAIRAWLDSA